MSYSNDIIPVCADCETSADYDTKTKLCERCGISFCVHFASLVDARYCSNCMVDFKVTETIETKTTIYENSNGTEVTRKRQIAKSLRLEGTDWLFANTQISLLNDEQLLAAIEYHRNIAGIMLLEREERKTEQLNKLSRVKINIRKPEDATKQPRVTKTKEVKTAEAKKQSDIAKALAGLTQEELAKLLAKLMNPTGA